MRIGFVTEGYPPMSGGVATSAQRIARELVELGHDVIVLSFDNTKDVVVDDYVVEEYDYGVELYRVGPFFLKNKNISAEAVPEKCKAILRRRAEAQMLKILKMKNVDIILTFYLMNAGYIGQLLAYELEIPCVAGVRGNDIGRNIYCESRFAMIRWVVDSADAVVCVNRHLMNRTALVFRETRDKLSVIHNGFNLQKREELVRDKIELCKKLGWHDDDLIVTFIGLLREKKGVVTLAKAIEKVNSNNAHIRLLIIGPDISGIEKMMIEDLWRKICGDNLVYITGLIPREEVLSWASAADVVCIPSLDDGMANGLLEGMSLGLCPITTTILDDVVVNRENGLVVEPGDEDKLAEAFEELYCNKDLIALFGGKSKKDIEDNYTPRKEAEAYVELFTKILEGRK